MFRRKFVSQKALFSIVLFCLLLLMFKINKKQTNPVESQLMVTVFGLPLAQRQAHDTLEFLAYFTTACRHNFCFVSVLYVDWLVG